MKCNTVKSANKDHEKLFLITGVPNKHIVKWFLAKDWE